MIEPLACSIHAVQRGNIEFGDVVVVAGAGTLGLGMIGAAEVKNPGVLIAVDLMPKRLEVRKSWERILDQPVRNGCCSSSIRFDGRLWV